MWQTDSISSLETHANNLAAWCVKWKKRSENIARMNSSVYTDTMYHGKGNQESGRKALAARKPIQKKEQTDTTTRDDSRQSSDTPGVNK